MINIVKQSEQYVWIKRSSKNKPKEKIGMKLHGTRLLLAGLGILLSSSLCVASVTNTVLVCNGAEIMRHMVVGGIWTSNHFANVNNIGGIASDGDSVFVGEYVYNQPGRILEYDTGGNFMGPLVIGIPKHVEHMTLSQDGNWLYASVGIWLADDAAIHRYDPVTGAGGVFIPNQGADWKFKIPRGLVEDDDGNLWISDRDTGSVYKFSSAGTYLDKVTSLPEIQTLYFSSEDQKIYGVTTGDNTYVIDPATGVATTNTITGLGARMGITQIDGTLYGSPGGNAHIASYDLDLLTFSNVTATISGVKQMITVQNWILGTFVPPPEPTATLLVCNGAEILQHTIVDGTWTSTNFVNVNNIGGIASDGDSVFVGEYVYNQPGRILEYDMEGTYLAPLVTGVPKHIEHMTMSRDGNWLYASVGIWLADDAAIHRYDPVTGAGGVFIPNQGADWKFKIPRGLVEDDDGNLWVSDRDTGSVYIFDNDGTYLDKVTSLPGIQTLYYSSVDQKIYGTTTGDDTYVIDPATGVATTNTITGLGARQGITKIDGMLYSAPSGDITSYDLNSLLSFDLTPTLSGVKQIIRLSSEVNVPGTLIIIK